jgi:segregation and condensation protein B
MMSAEDENKEPQPTETTEEPGEESPDDQEQDETTPPIAETVSDEVQISRLESIIFVSPGPISVRRLARILSLEGKRVRELLDTLVEQYAERGIILQEVSGGFQFRSHPNNARIIREIFKLKPLKISRAALEALAIVAYRQPLTRSEVEEIRGVDCGGVLKYLFEKELVRVIGRKEEPGRPIIYGTSPTFLELFGLKALSDLPSLQEFSELWEEHQEIVDTETPVEEDFGENGLESLINALNQEKSTDTNEDNSETDEADTTNEEENQDSQDIADNQEIEISEDPDDDQKDDDFNEEEIFDEQNVDDEKPDNTNEEDSQ